MTAKYQRIDNGAETTADDPKRGVWYSARCSYWTDEWDTLVKLRHGLPVCPHCSSPGFQIDFDQWLPVPEQYEAEHPGYTERLMANRNAVCRQR